MESRAAHLGEFLSRRGLTLAVAESCTGGLVGGCVTAAAGSSRYFRGGVIAYDNDIKRDVLGVSAESLEKHGAVSEPVVREMATGAAKLLGCDCAVSVSGIAGPDGGTEEKPVGLVCIGTFFRGETQSRSFVFQGNREEVRSQTVTAVLDFLIETLMGIRNIAIYKR
jgi:nicotinamide-nucleotide amidase